MKNKLYRIKVPEGFYGSIHCVEYDIKNNKFVNDTTVCAIDEDLIVRVCENWILAVIVFYHIRRNKFICMRHETESIFYEKV